MEVLEGSVMTERRGRRRRRPLPTLLIGPIEETTWEGMRKGGETLTLRFVTSQAHRCAVSDEMCDNSSRVQHGESEDGKGSHPPGFRPRPLLPFWKRRTK